MMLDQSAYLLAKGDLGDLIWLVIVFGFYAVGAITKMLANRSKTDDGESSETSKSVELAKKYAKQSQLKQQALEAARIKRKESIMSDWDRQQELKRQQFAQRRGFQEHPKSVQPPQWEPIPVAKPVEQPKPQVAPQIPRYHQVTRSNHVVQIVHTPKIQKPARKQIVPPLQTKKSPTKPAKVKETPKAKAIKTSSSLKDILNHPNQLRSAVVLKEILDKPLALREVF